MSKKRGRFAVIIALSVTVSVLIATHTRADADFERLLDAVDKAEATLKQAVQQEAKTRQAEIESLKRELAQLRAAIAAAPPPVPADTQTMDTELEALRRDLDSLRVATVARPSNDADLAELMVQIAVLRNRFDSLAGDSGPTAQLASLNIGWAPPAGNPGQPPTVKEETPPVVIDGFVHEQFLDAADESSSFVTKRARLGVKGKVNPWASIRIVGEFASTPRLLDANLAFSPGSHWTVTAGQYKVPFVADFQIATTAYPFVNASLLAGAWSGRDIGSSAVYQLKAGKHHEVRLTGGVFNGADINKSDVNNEKNYVGRLELARDKALKLTSGFVFGKTNDTGVMAHDITRWVVSGEYKYRRVIVDGEYVHDRTGTTRGSGWYLWTAASVPATLPWLQSVQGLLRYEELTDDLDDSDSRTSRTTFATNLYFDEKAAKLQVNYQLEGDRRDVWGKGAFLVNMQVAF